MPIPLDEIRTCTSGIHAHRDYTTRVRPPRVSRNKHLRHPPVSSTAKTIMHETLQLLSICHFHCQQCNDTHTNDYLLFCPGTWRRSFFALQYVLNVFIFRFFVKSLSMPIDSLLTTIFFLETKRLPSIPTKRYESEPDLPKPKLLLSNAGRFDRHCLSIEKTSNRQRRGKLTMSSRLAG